MGSGSSIQSTVPKLNDFKIYSTIGIGGFSKVENAKYIKNKTYVALKTTNITAALSRSNGYEILTSEIESLIRLGHHPYIAKLHYAFHDYFECYMALELYPCGDLRFQLDVGAVYNESCVSYIMWCMGSALQYMHSKGTIHRDIKPENIVLSKDGVPHLTDFGVSYYGGNTQSDVLVCKSTSGTKPYSSPEFLTRSRRHGTAADYWSLGITAFELLTGTRPFSSPPIEYIHYAERIDYYADFCTTIDLGVTTLANDNVVVTPNIQIDQSISITPPICGGAAAVVNTAPNITTISNEKPIENVDGPIPPLIETFLPTSLVFTQHCIDFITEILDPRIIHRLGGETSRNSLLKHPWVQSHIETKRSPLKDVLYYVPADGLSSTYLSRRVSNKGSCSQHPLVDVRLSPKYSDKIEQVLQLYQYTNTLDQSNNNFNKKLNETNRSSSSNLSKSQRTGELSSTNPPSPPHKSIQSNNTTTNNQNNYGILNNSHKHFFD